MKWLRALAPVVVALALAWFLSGAGILPQAPLPLVQVLDLAPHEIEPGDRLGIVGAGFPSGKPARVTFRGVLYRPGEQPLAGVEITAWGSAIASNQVDVAFDEGTQSLFCGAGDKATHTTFEGEVEVAFAAAVAGSPPVAGVLPVVTLDVRPAATAGEAARDREGERVLSFLGLRVAATERATGLRIEAVTPESRAHVAGLVPGDVITRVGGLRVLSAGDVVPAAGAREAALGVRRVGVPGEVSRVVAMNGLKRAPPSDLLGAG